MYYFTITTNEDIPTRFSLVSSQYTEARRLNIPALQATILFSFSWHNPGPTVIELVTSNCKTSPGNNSLSTQLSKLAALILFNALNVNKRALIKVLQVVLSEA